MIVCLAATACLLAPASPSTGASRPFASLVATPARVVLAGRRAQTVELHNGGAQRVVVDVTRAGFALDLRGRPRVLSGRKIRISSGWLRVSPHVLAVPAGQSRGLRISARLPPHAEPGDHEALVLVTSRPRRRGAVFVRMRLGLVVVVRAPGKIVRRLTPLRLRVRRNGRTRLLDLLIANRGNVTEVVARGCLAITLRGRARRAERLAPAPRQLLPRTRGLAEIRYRGRTRGRVTVRVRSTGRSQCPRLAARTFRARL